jgi:hypothetical protein
MRQGSRHELLELGYEQVNALGREVEPEQFDGDEPIAIGIVRTKNRPQYAGADLIQDSKWTEGGVWRRTRSFLVQWKTPQGRLTNRNTEAPLVQSFKRANARRSQHALRAVAHSTLGFVGCTGACCSASIDLPKPRACERLNGFFGWSQSGSCNQHPAVLSSSPISLSPGINGPRIDQRASSRSGPTLFVMAIWRTQPKYALLG